MANTNDKPFRFLDLPGELRNRIYVFLLCSFEEPDFDEWLLTPRTSHFEVGKTNLNSGILRTSTQVHREAYDIMVKTNRFVHLVTTDGLPIERILPRCSFPVVSRNAKRVSQFEGYVTKIVLSLKRPLVYMKDINYRLDWSSAQGSSIMMLSRDLPVLCMALAGAGLYIPEFSSSISLCVEVAPILSTRITRYKDSLEDFAVNTQERILHPLRNILQEFSNVEITGVAAPELAKATVQKVAKERGTHLKNTLQRLEDAERICSQAIIKTHYAETCDRLKYLGFQVQQVREERSLEVLLSRGGDGSITRLDEVLLQRCLTRLEFCLPKDVDSELEMALESSQHATLCEKQQHIAKESIAAIRECLKLGYWSKGCIRKPGLGEAVGFTYFMARFYRLLNDVPNTIRYIRQAFHHDAYSWVPEVEYAEYLQWATAMLQGT